MVILYQGAFCEFPAKENIIATDKEDWIKLVKENGFKLDPHYRVGFDGHNSYIDFGSWSYFIVEIDEH